MPPLHKRSRFLLIVAAMLTVVFPVVQTVAIVEAHANSAVGWSISRAIVRSAGWVGPPGAVLFKLVLASGVAYFLAHSDQVAAIRTWMVANYTYKTDGPDGWQDYGAGVGYQGEGNPGVPYWDAPDGHWHIDGWILRYGQGWNGERWMAVSTLTAPTPEAAWSAFNRAAANIIKQYSPNAISGWEEANALPSNPDPGPYRGIGPDLAQNGGFYASPGSGPEMMNAFNSGAVPTVVHDNMTYSDAMDQINRYNLTQVNGETGQQAASPLDNASVADRQNYVQNQQMLDKLAQVNDSINAIPDKLTDAMDAPTSLTSRWQGLWYVAQQKFPFTIWNLTNITPTASTTETWSLGYYPLAPGQVQVEILPFRSDVMGDLPAKFRSGMALLVYAATAIFIIKRASAI